MLPFLRGGGADEIGGGAAQEGGRRAGGEGVWRVIEDKSGRGGSGVATDGGHLGNGALDGLKRRGGKGGSG